MVGREIVLAFSKENVGAETRCLPVWPAVVTLVFVGVSRSHEANQRGLQVGGARFEETYLGGNGAHSDRGGFGGRQEPRIKRFGLTQCGEPILSR